MEKTLITLAEFHYELGYIGYDEFHERIQVALWLAEELDGIDPRLSSEKKSPPSRNRDEVSNESASCHNAPDKDQDNLFEVTLLKKWVFTKSDPDSYPSIPHGHYQSQNSPWPKLNPYTGRVFDAKHQENNALRLSKNDMKNIWQNERFKSFCREMIVWYREQFPYYDFPVRRPLRMPRW